jgi:carboxylesterase
VKQARSTQAFRLAGGRRGGVLLVHGFTGTPHEMEPLAEPLAGAGFDVLGVRLPGHGDASPDERNEAATWQAAVSAGLDELEAAGARSITVVGLSMGALLALDLAARERERVRAVVALSPAIVLSALPRLLLGLGRFAPPGVRGRLMPSRPSDIRDAEVRAAHPKSAPFPLSVALSFDALRRATRARVGSVAQPLLIVHSRLDRTCALGGAAWLARAVGSPAVEMHVLERSGHVIPVDLEREAATRLVLDFVERQVPHAVGSLDGTGGFEAPPRR